jgi:hypothetical protein
MLYIKRTIIYHLLVLVLVHLHTYIIHHTSYIITHNTQHRQNIIFHFSWPNIIILLKRFPFEQLCALKRTKLLLKLLSLHAYIVLVKLSGRVRHAQDQDQRLLVDRSDSDERSKWESARTKGKGEDEMSTLFPSFPTPHFYLGH